MLAWKVRAALRAGSQPRWPQVLEATAAMGERPAATRPGSTGAPVRWPRRRPRQRRRPRALKATHQLLEGIASVRGFYEQLALEELGRTIRSCRLPYRPADRPRKRKAARLNPGLNRAACTPS
jgi:soluble lytic murein transglycosylase